MSTRWTQTQQAGKKEKKVFEAENLPSFLPFSTSSVKLEICKKCTSDYMLNTRSLQVMSKHDMNDSKFKKKHVNTFAHNGPYLKNERILIISLCQLQ